MNIYEFSVLDLNIFQDFKIKRKMIFKEKIENF